MEMVQIYKQKKFLLEVSCTSWDCILIRSSQPSHHTNPMIFELFKRAACTVRCALCFRKDMGETYVVGGVDLGDEVLSEEGNLLRGGLAGKPSRRVPRGELNVPGGYRSSHGGCQRRRGGQQHQRRRRRQQTWHHCQRGSAFRPNNRCNTNNDPVSERRAVSTG